MVSSHSSVCFSKILANFLVCLFLVIPVLHAEADAAEYSIYGPRVFLRDTGAPFVETDTIVAAAPGSYRLKIYNAGLTHTEYKHVSSAVITLNGVNILSPNELNQQVDYIEKMVTLQQLNELSVEVRSKPGSALVIGIAGIDNDLPLIIANVTPQANANDWHRTDVTVTFDCSDSLSGIASCTAPVFVTAEGAAQVVTGTAVDNAGNTADASVEINLDKTPPVVNITSPDADSLTTQSNITIIGQTYDTLSFVTATINGIDLGLLMDGGFSYSTTLTEGLNTFTVVAVDRADNSTTRQFTITYQPVNNPPVALPISVITQQDNPVEITLTASDEDGDALNYLIVKQPEHGQLSGSGAMFSYQPDVNYHGLDSFDYVANDSVDNSNIATVTIEVEKQLASIVLSPPADIIVEATAKLTPLDIGVAAATDARGTSIDVVSDNKGPYPLGVTLVTWTATNKQGETASVQQKITVQDTTPPVVTLNGPDLITTHVEYRVYEFGATAYDLVDGDVTESIIISNFNKPIGHYGYDNQYTATDASGNSASVTRAIISSHDSSLLANTSKVVNYAYENIIEAVGQLTPIEQPVVRDYLGNELVILVLEFSVFNGSVYEQTTPIPGQLPVGNYEFAAYSVGSNSVYGKSYQKITVADTTPPILTLTGPSIVNIYVDTAPYEEAGATAYDIVAGDLTSEIQMSGTVDTSTPGSYRIVYEVTDNYSNISQVIRTVNVITDQDITPPVITPPNDIVEEATAILTTVNLGSAVATDDFDGTLVAIPNMVGPFSAGQHSVIWSAEDAAGNVGTAAQTVSIVDTTPPVLTIPEDITIAFDHTGSIVTGAAQATDIFPVSITNNAPVTYPTGSTAVLWQAVDANGNSAVATQLITVNASLAPIAIAGTDKTVSINMPIIFDATSSFDPDGEIVSYIWKSNSAVLSTDITFIKTDLTPGEHLVTLTVTDNSGTASTTSITITIVDAPVQTMTQCRLETIVDDTGFLDIYPDDNITYLGENYSDVVEIENAFNSARYQDKSVSKYLKMPSQSVWDAMSAQQKGLYLVNSERLARNLKPFEGTSQNIVNAAQDYAEYIRVNNQIIGHYNDGRSPQQRMDEDPVILNNRDGEIGSENIFAKFASTLADVGTSDERIVQAVYAFTYEDNYPLFGEAWGHRSSILQFGLLDNSGIDGEEGLIGFGVARGEYNPENSQFFPYGSVVVMNLVDASSLAEYIGVETVTAALTIQCNDALNIELDQSTTQLPTIERLYISESQLVLVVGQSQYINVTGVFSDGSEQDVTHLVDFVADNLSVVSINAGQVTGLVAGSVGITVSANGISSNRLIISVGEKTDTSNLTGSDAEQYIPYIPDNASVNLYNANTLTLLTGQVNDLYNVGLAGVSVSILNHLDYGTTLTDNNGKFIFAVPAGNHVVSLAKAGYLSVQKNISAPGHSWGIVETATLQAIDEKSTTIDLSSSTTQIHQSTPYTDLRGTRATTLVFDGINTATVTSADGMQRTLSGFSVSATEFTTPETMPGVLPETSAYTYCADLNIAGVADNESVSFDNDVIMYVDNFLGFEVGEIVPIGYYDRLSGEWTGSKNGVVVRLLDSNSDGLVDGVDYTGDDIADDIDGDGSSTDETRGIENYPIGETYWRGAFNHFTPVDFNWSTSFGNDAAQAEKFPIGTNEGDEDDNECKDTNSYVDIKSSAFHEDITIAGTNLTLHYNSQRTEGYRHNINVRVSGDQVPLTLVEMVVKVEIAGVVLQQKFYPQTNMEANFVWDGYNAVGEIERGEVNGVIKVGYTFPVNYNSNGNAATTSLSLDQFKQAWAKTGPNVTTVAGRQDGTLWTTQKLTLYNAPESEIASGWTLSNQHVLTASDKIYMGSGSVQDIVSASNVLKTGVVDSFIPGDDGFYQKAGKAIDYDILTGNILRDNVTDLMWQYQNPQYFSSNREAANYCENLDLGGFTDWRLVTLKEDTYTKNKGNLINEVVIYSGSAPVRWNSLTFNFPNGPQNNLPVYCVRGEILDDKYIKSLERNIIDEVVVDKSNGLMWQDDSSVLSTQGDWVFAINHCEALGKAGYNDWRLPNINEFMYVLPNNTFSNQFEFPPEPWTRTHPEARPFWSSTPNVLNISNAWAIESEGYNSANYPQTDNNYVRCVRDDLSQARSPYLFDAAGKHIESIDLDTGTTLLTYSYDASTGKLNSITDLFGNQISLIRENGVLTTIESPDGLLTRLVVYNNDLIEVSYEDGSGYQFEYQSSLMTLEVDPNANQYPHIYDALGRVDYITDPENGVWTFHNTRDSLLSAKVYGYTTAEGRLYESQRVVENGLITKTTRNEDGTTVLETENTNTLITTTESGGVTTVRTEAADQKTQKPQFSKQLTTLPGGLSSTLDTVKTYASNGADFSKLTTSIIINNKTNTIVDDFKLGTKVLNSAENRQVTISYDPLTLLTSSVQNADLFATTYQYDNRGRIALTTTGNRSSSNSYETIGRGKLTASTDALNRTTSYEYDLLGRLSAKTLPDSRTIHYRYDANGNLTGIIPPGKSEHIIEYNGVDNKLQYTPPGLVQINTAYTQYRYNRDRELTQIIRPDLQVIDFIYNNQAQVTVVDTPGGATLYNYNATTGNVELITAPDGNTLSYLYDGPLNTQTTWAGEINANVSNTYNNDFVISQREINGTHAISFARDNDLLLTQAGALSINRNATNGLISDTNIDNSTSIISYNNYGEVDNYSALYNSTTQYQVSYQYDLIGRISQKQETIEGITSLYDYSYDLGGRLETVSIDGNPVATYTYDSNGNRTHVNGVPLGEHDAQDRLTQYGTTQYRYTDNGELQQASNIQTGETTNYHYDVSGNLMQVTLPDNTQIDYLIDGQNRRIGKKVNGSLTQGFVYKDQLNPIAELDGNNQVITRFIYATRANVPDYMIKGGTSYRIISDHLGSPRLVINTQTGTVAQRIDYDTWGNITADTNPGFQPFGFAGGLYDQHTRLTRFGARDYDAATARWTAKDPIGFSGGDTNLYGYTFNDPVNFTDRNGLYVWGVNVGGSFTVPFIHVNVGFSVAAVADHNGTSGLLYTGGVGVGSEGATGFLRGLFATGSDTTVDSLLNYGASYDMNLGRFSGSVSLPGKVDDCGILGIDSPVIELGLGLGEGASITGTDTGILGKNNVLGNIGRALGSAVYGATH